jgi:hypothetical protein
MSLEKNLKVVNAYDLKSMDTINRITKAMELGATDSLSESDQETYDMIDFADNQVRLYGPGKKASKMVAEHYKVSKSMADRLCNSAQMIFGSVARANKDYFKNYATEKLVRAITTLEEDMGLNVDLKEGEIRDINPQKMKAYQALIKELRETIGYDKEELELPDFSEMGSNVIVAIADPAALGIGDTRNLDAKLNDMISKITVEDAKVDLSEE